MGRRLVILLALLVVAGAPAAALRADCVGASCPASPVTAPAPFCSLPADLRALITAGTYEGRSPDVLGVAANTQVTTDVSPSVPVAWPSTSGPPGGGSVPLLFVGKLVAHRSLEDVALDRIAPTESVAIGLRRPHPEVRHGQMVPGVVAAGGGSPLVVTIVWKGVGTDDLGHRAPWLAHAMDPSTTWGGGVRAAVGTGRPASLPLDPTAIEATIGTGGLPSQHGITGTWIRGKGGVATQAFGRGSPQPVIATLGDDLDRATGGAALIGLVGDDPGDAGLVGDGWYGTGQVRDRTVRAGTDPAATVEGFLARGWGADRTPDLLGVALGGSVGHDDRATAAIVARVLDRVPSATIVISGTGSLATADAVTPVQPAGTVHVRGGGAAGGYFLDRTAGAAATASTVVDAMHAETGADGAPLYADAFASYAVRFGRYC
jgi:hypothetical protein